MSTITDIENTLKVASPWIAWINNIVKAAVGSSTNVSQAAETVVSTAAPAATASVSLGITSDIGEGFKAFSAVTNLIAQRDQENNTPAMVQAANAAKIQKLKDHAAAVIDYAEKTGDLTGVKLLLS